MSRKLTVTLILILFLLPFGSWYYLNSGLKWRKHAQEALQGKTPFPATDLVSTRGKKVGAEQLGNHVSLITMMKCDSSAAQQEFVQGLYAQFKETGKANFIFLDTCSGASSSWVDSININGYRIQCQDSLNACDPIWLHWQAGFTYGLIDRDGIIRNYYKAQTREEKRMLVEHMAILLPRERSEKVELKRGADTK